MICSRCQKEYAVENEYGFCDDCLKSFIPMIEELQFAFIHHYMHPEKNEIYVHDDQSKRYRKKEVKI